MRIEDQLKLQTWIKEAKNIVFLGGAGVSTASGIPDFRGKNGLSQMKSEIPFETLLSHDYFMNHTKSFYEFYLHHMIYRQAMPNACHLALAALETTGRLIAVITQNIDGLHQKAGSKNVLELHGSVENNECMECHKPYPLDELFAYQGVPKCSCGGIIKPKVVLYGEILDPTTIKKSIQAIKIADLLMVGGTSLLVHPAASLLSYFHGNHLVIINQSPTPYDSLADLILTDPIEQIFPTLIF